MAIVITLPTINGEIEAGITIGVDASLPDDKKLPILFQAGVPSILNVIKSNAAVWAYKQFQDVVARKLFINGVVAILDLGMVCYSEPGVIPDGDWRSTAKAEEGGKEIEVMIRDSVNLDDMKKAATVAVATKANYWLMNHHTGQGQVAGYVKKVLDVFLKDHVTEQVVSAAHSLGHFTSTRLVLNIIKF